MVLDPVNVNANGLTLRGVEFDYQTPRYHNYNVTLQAEPFPNHSVEIGFVGTRGRHLETFTGMNNVQVSAAAGHQSRSRSCNSRTSPAARSTSGRSASARMIRCRPSSSGGITRGLQFLMSYTLSDSKTNAGDSLSGGGVGGLRAPDVAGWDLANDIGLSGFHTKHAFVFSGSYDLPGKGPILSGWRTNWVLSLYSGQAQTINCSVASGSGTGCYALMVGDPYAGTHDVTQFYNPAAFADPKPVATIGQTDFSPLGGPRSQVTGPPLRQLDMGVARQIRLRGQSQFEVRVEAFNITNLPAFNAAGIVELPGRQKLRQHHEHAQHAASDSARRQGVLVTKRRLKAQVSSLTVVSAET